MTPTPTPTQMQLLASLASGVRPVDLGEQDQATGDRFSSMLEGALGGHARSELGVTFAPSASGLFDATEQERIARAVDIAAAAGSERALIMHDRHTLRVDVRNRVVLEAPETEPEQALMDIDAFVQARGAQAESDEEENEGDLPHAPMGLSVPARVVRNASLARTLAQAGGGPDAMDL